MKSALLVAVIGRPAYPPGNHCFRKWLSARIWLTGKIRTRSDAKPLMFEVGVCFAAPAACIASAAGKPMIARMQDRQDHFAYCVQLFGGTTAFSRRLRIDERAIRRFINGERPVSDGLLEDTAKALRELIAEASEAVEQISASLAPETSDP